MSDAMMDFGLDTSSFDKGMKRIEKGLTGLPKAAKGISKGMSSGIKSMAVKLGVLFVALKGIKGLLNSMPEIGEAFGIAKDIFLKNLLFPLRKLVFPMLQKMLDWVRDNRTQFVKWGQVIANVFSVVVVAVKAVIKTAKSLVQSFAGFFENLFGKPVKNIEELFNILSFKASVVIIFIQKLISSLLKEFAPTFETIGKTLNILITMVSDFVFAFVEGFLKINEKMSIMDEVKKIFTDINDILSELMPVLGPLGKLLGEVFGVTLLAALKLVQFALETILDTIKLIKGLGTVVKGDVNLFSPDFKDLPEKNPSLRSGPGMVDRRINDGIVQNGKIISTHPDDTILAMKNLEPRLSSNSESQEGGNGNRKIEIKIDFSGMNIILKNGSPEEAVEVGENIVSTIRQTLAKELEIAGV